MVAKRKKTMSEVEEDLREDLRITKAELHRCQVLLERPDDPFAGGAGSTNKLEPVRATSKVAELVKTMEETACLLKNSETNDEKQFSLRSCLRSVFKFEKARNVEVATDMLMQKFFKSTDDRYIPLGDILQICMLNPRECPKFTHAMRTTLVLSMTPTPHFLDATRAHFRKQHKHLWDARNGVSWEDRNEVLVPQRVLFDVLGIKSEKDEIDYMRYMLDWKNMNNTCTTPVTRSVCDKKYNVLCGYPVTDKGDICTTHLKILEKEKLPKPKRFDPKAPLPEDLFT